MCGIIFGKPDVVIDIFEKQQSRGLDAVGIVTYEKGVDSYRIGPEEPNGKVAIDSYISMLNKRFTEYPVIGNLLFHHRKASVGKGGLEGAHPYKGHKFYLMQNGTCKDMRIWGDIEMIDKDKSDTYCLLQFIERHCKHLKEVEQLMMKVPWAVGTIFVADRHGHILFFSDKLRESYVHIEDDKVVRISSKNPDNLDAEYTNVGSLIFKFNGDIIENNLLSPINSVKEKPKATYYPSYWEGGTSGYNKTYTKDWFNDIDLLDILVISCGGCMNKKTYKQFIPAYDDFYQNVYRVTTYTTVKRDDFHGKFMSDREYAYRKWARKYPYVVKLLEEFQIQDGDANYSFWSVLGGYQSFKQQAKYIVDTLRVDRIKTPIIACNPNDVIPEQTNTLPIPVNNESHVNKYISELSKKKPAISMGMGDVVIFDDGTEGVVLSMGRVLYKEAEYSVVEVEATGDSYIQVKEKADEMVMGVFKNTTAYVKKYICNVINYETP